MAECPECKMEIEHLKYFAKVESFGLFQPDSVNFDEWEETNRGDWVEMEFYCPECDKIIFREESEARGFFENDK